MAAVASKNLYELLGNDHDEDSDKEPEPPVKVVDKTPARTDKRNHPREAPSAPAGSDSSRGGRRGGYSGNEAAFRDRTAGSANNRGKPTDDGLRQDRHRGGDRAQGTYEGRGRGGRGGRGRGAPRDDRHSKSVAADSEKQAAHGWGANEGSAELADEQAGEAIAETDEKEAVAEGEEATPDNAEAAPAAEPEPEDTTISYADYLAKQAEKKLALGTLEIRQPNEGTKENKQWAHAKAVTKEEDEDFISGSGGKAKRERERKQKQVVEIDQRFVEAPESRGGRGGRGRGDGVRRGSRGDGPSRGGRGDGQFRGNRGDGPRGGRGRGDGPYRGSRGGPRGGAPAINTEDTNAFPSLGS